MGNVHAMYNLSLLYQENDEINKMIKWLKIAIGKGDVESMVAYGNHLLHSDRDINRAVKYYNLAKLKNYYRGYYELAYYYCEFKFNYEHFKKNIILFLESNDEDRDLYSSPTKLRNVALLKLMEVIFKYENEKDINFLKLYFIKFGIDVEKIDKYNDRIKMREQYMTNKRKFKLVEEEKETDCGICYERKELIVFDCLGHYMCVDCYLRVNKCPFCSIEKHQLMKIRKIPEDEPVEESNDTNIIEDVSDDEDIIESEDISIVSTIDDDNNNEVDGILNINIDDDEADIEDDEADEYDDDDDDEDDDDEDDEDADDEIDEGE